MNIERHTIDLWRFGLSPAKVISQIKTWLREGWRPDCILVSCAMTTWWQGARDLIGHIKSSPLADVPIILGGAYATFYPEHAAVHTAADSVYIGAISDITGMVPDFSLYLRGRVPRGEDISKYHSRTFDFLGDGLVARLVRRSLRQHLWEP